MAPLGPKMEPVNILQLRQSADSLQQLIVALEDSGAHEDNCGQDFLAAEREHARKLARKRYKSPMRTVRIEGQKNRVPGELTQADKIWLGITSASTDRDRREVSHVQDPIRTRMQVVSDDDVVSTHSSQDSDFLVFETDELAGGDDNYNLHHSQQVVADLFNQLRITERLDVTHDMSEWFEEANNATDVTESDLVLKEKRIQAADDELDCAPHQVDAAIDSRDLQVFEQMRKFREKFVTLRSGEDKKSAHSHLRPRLRNKSLRDDSDSAESPTTQRRLRVKGATAISSEPASIEQWLSGGRAQPPTQDSLSSTERQGGNQVSAFASDLLEVIAWQQDEIADLRTKSDLNIQKSELMRHALEHVRRKNEHENDVDKSGMGGQSVNVRNTRGAFVDVPLADAVKDVLDEVSDEMKMRGISELLGTPDGRNFLGKCAETTHLQLEGHTRAAEVIEQCDMINSQMEEVEKKLEAVGNPREREEKLRHEIKRLHEMSSANAHRNVAVGKYGQKKDKKQTGAVAAEAAARVPADDAAAKNGGDGDDSSGVEAASGPGVGGRAGQAPTSRRRSSWLAELSAEAVKQLVALCFDVQKTCQNVDETKVRFLDALSEAKKRVIEERDEKSKLMAAGVVDFDDVDGPEKLRQVQVMAQVRERRAKLEDGRIETQNLQAEEAQLKAVLTRLRKALRHGVTGSKSAARAEARASCATRKGVRTSSLPPDNVAGGELSTKAPTKAGTVNSRLSALSEDIGNASTECVLPVLGQEIGDAATGPLDVGQEEDELTGKNEPEPTNEPKSVAAMRVHLKRFNQEAESLIKIEQDLQALLAKATEAAESAKEVCAKGPDAVRSTVKKQNVVAVPGAATGSGAGGIAAGFSAAAMSGNTRRSRGQSGQGDGSQSDDGATCKFASSPGVSVASVSITIPTAAGGFKSVAPHSAGRAMASVFTSAAAQAAIGGPDAISTSRPPSMLGLEADRNAAPGATAGDATPEVAALGDHSSVIDGGARVAAASPTLGESVAAASPTPGVSGIAPLPTRGSIVAGIAGATVVATETMPDVASAAAAAAAIATLDPEGDAELSDAPIQGFVNDGGRRISTGGECQRSSTGGRRRSSLVTDSWKVETQTVVVDKREEQIKELLFYQNEHNRLQQEISDVEKAIRDAKARNQDKHHHGVQSIISSAPTELHIPEENRNLRREVTRRRRELNELRKKWWSEKARLGAGVYEGSAPGRLEAAVKLLLRDAQKKSAVQAKAAEEAEKRAAMEQRSAGIGRMGAVRRGSVRRGSVAAASSSSGGGAFAHALHGPPPHLQPLLPRPSVQFDQVFWQTSVSLARMTQPVRQDPQVVGPGEPSAREPGSNQRTIAREALLSNEEKDPAAPPKLEGRIQVIGEKSSHAGPQVVRFLVPQGWNRTDTGASSTSMAHPQQHGGDRPVVTSFATTLLRQLTQHGVDDHSTCTLRIDASSIPKQRANDTPSELLKP